MENGIDRVSEFIEKIETQDTGGGCLVDFVYLSTGHVLTINEDVIVVWKDPEDFYEDPEKSIGEVFI